MLILLFLATIVAFWISAICGGGASLVLLPLLNLLMPASEVPFSLTIGTFTSSASRIVVFKKHINWTIVTWFVPFSLPSVLLGAWLLKFVNPLYLQLVVALFLLANIPQLFSRKKKDDEQKRNPKYVLAIVGFLAGLVSGVTGAIGLLFNRFYLRYGLTKDEIVATRATNEIILHLVKLVIYIMLGLYSKTAVYIGCTVAVAAVLSSFTVRYILPFISDGLFKKVGYAAMVISGAVLLVSTSNKIIHQDNLHLATKEYGTTKETTIHWRQSDLVLEYSWNGGLEIERPITVAELSPQLKIKYQELLAEYDEILLEKVFKFRQPVAYEFYCYKDRRLTKLELQ
ncbi:MAG: sulfite exporter TauE/SafE family protein [Chitinophagaceae bacterium]